MKRFFKQIAADFLLFWNCIFYMYCFVLFLTLCIHQQMFLMSCDTLEMVVGPLNAKHGHYLIK